jgi:hypothetical protein
MNAKLYKHAISQTNFMHFKIMQVMNRTVQIRNTGVELDSSSRSINIKDLFICPQGRHGH